MIGYAGLLVQEANKLARKDREVAGKISELRGRRQPCRCVLSSPGRKLAPDQPRKSGRVYRA